MIDTRSRDLFADYPNTPGHKGGDTSREAAAAIAPKVGRLKTLVISCINKHPLGLTPDECAAKLGIDILSIRPRFSELHRESLIEKTGERRPNRSGLLACVWRAARRNEGDGA